MIMYSEQAMEIVYRLPDKMKGSESKEIMVRLCLITKSLKPYQK